MTHVSGDPRSTLQHTRPTPIFTTATTATTIQTVRLGAQALPSLVSRFPSSWLHGFMSAALAWYGMRIGRFHLDTRWCVEVPQGKSALLKVEECVSGAC